MNTQSIKHNSHGMVEGTDGHSGNLGLLFKRFTIFFVEIVYKNVQKTTFNYFYILHMQSMLNYIQHTPLTHWKVK